MEFVERARVTDGSSARLFPEIERGPKGTFGEVWSKWFGRYKRSLGIANENSVFHSFRHGFKDALRAAQVSEDINDALTGHTGSNRVARGYGWKDMVRRFGLPALQAALEKVAYPGLDLSRIRWKRSPRQTTGRTEPHRSAGPTSIHSRPKMRNAGHSLENKVLLSRKIRSLEG